jgi:hypothetical protein
VTTSGVTNIKLAIVLNGNAADWTIAYIRISARAKQCCDGDEEILSIFNKPPAPGTRSIYGIVTYATAHRGAFGASRTLIILSDM